MPNPFGRRPNSGTHLYLTSVVISRCWPVADASELDESMSALLDSGRGLHAKENYPLVVRHDYVGHIFMYGYPAAVCIVTIFFFWRGMPKESCRIFLYILLLALIGPLTFINYMMRDQWLNLFGPKRRLHRLL
jgi:hypothetical protein